MKAEQLKEMNAIRWWHCIELEPGLFTPGECKHGNGEFESRWGFEKDYTGKTVLDIGAWDGLFSFEAEKRGAKVTAIDVNEGEGGNWGRGEGFLFAKNYLNSDVVFHLRNIQNDLLFDKRDIVFFFGVLYHLEEPIKALRNVYELCNEYAIIETAISQVGQSVLEIIPGKENDPTNLFYPSIAGMIDLCKIVGFESAFVYTFCGI